MKHVQVFTDRHGRQRCYLRKPGHKRVALPLPHESGFSRELAKALAQGTLLTGLTIKPGSVEALILAYQHSRKWTTLDPETRRQAHGVLDRIRHALGDRTAAKIARKDIEAYLDTLADRPAALNQHLKRLRVLFKHAVETGVRKDDPSYGIPRAKTRAGGWPVWSEAHIKQFHARHGVGSKARLALDLLLHTEQRKGDVVRMGWQHVDEGVLRIEQEKTGAEIDSPLDPYLLAVLRRDCPRNTPAFLLTERGKPFTAAGFGNWFHSQVMEAGLPFGLSAHGLRKAALTRFADAGATEDMLIARSGHSNPSQVRVYTRTANRAALSRMALDLMVKPNPRVKPGNRNYLSDQDLIGPAKDWWARQGLLNPSVVNGLDRQTLSFAAALLANLAEGIAAPSLDRDGDHALRQEGIDTATGVEHTVFPRQVRIKA